MSNEATACCPPAALPRPPGSDVRQAGVLPLRAVADPTRIELFALIASREEPICVCDIAAHFEQKQPTISHHLKILRDAGLVTAERRGTWAYYALDPAGLGRLERTIGALTPATSCCTATTCCVPPSATEDSAA